ncbi:hypothetical protein IQ247_13470 [Plectonema cf. radiosum LEGE 06105]|uniref:Uncharacterized protein n=1 Tax=Plectonema cf. radiosum LEGE 06105 TaxID=945769 RepID=A0A8J7F2G8_9CYAN|nr:DUF6753 family protein [Plectonema radiosum]MBE9213662.1 hypothetical protein [Plectonema cf. radiosum LEGE 06105]
MASKGKKQPSHLDKLLEDKPPVFQAEVLRFAMDSGMRPEDPAFRLVQYIGYLAQLTETAPQDWKDLFEELQGELDEWTELTAEQLKAAADQSETINNLAARCNKLGTALNALDLTSQEQSEQLKNLSEISPILRNVAQEIPTLKQQLVSLNQSLTSNQPLRMELSQYQMHQLTTYHDRELSKIRRETEDLARYQKKIAATIVQRQKIGISRIWERIKNRILDLICRVDVLLTLVGWFLLMLIFCVILAVVTRAVFEISPPPGLSHFTQEQIYKTKEQMGYAYVKLQRIENHIGSNPKPKQKPKRN